MLGKVSVYINDNGEITYFDNPKRRVNLRGTKFSLPKPQFGRHKRQMILREDQLMQGQMAIDIKRQNRRRQKQEMAMKNTL
jgi:RNA-binding protein NOB1